VSFQLLAVAVKMLVSRWLLSRQWEIPRLSAELQSMLCYPHHQQIFASASSILRSRCKNDHKDL